MSETGSDGEDVKYGAWFSTTFSAAKAFDEAWDGSAEKAAEAVRAWCREVRAHIAGWESIEWPETFAPADGEVAVHDIANLANADHRGGHTRIVIGQHAAAEEYLQRSITTGLDDLQYLNDLAVICHAAGRGFDAEALLRLVLTLDPDREDARENLAALLGTGDSG